MSNVNRDDIIAAASRISGLVVETPLQRAVIDGVEIWLKCENLQTGGAFKLRGATNRLLQLSADQRAHGVVAYSSGNHARGIAIAARRLGIPAVIVMPADAPTVKVEGTRAEGAEIVFYDRLSESREAIAATLAAERGAVVVPSFDDPMIVAGQGTCGLEILAQFGRSPRRIVVPAGGGGLASGIALACPDAEIVCVEPEGWDDLGRSLAGGTIVAVAPDAPPTLCDALQTLRVARLTFEILRKREVRAITVSEDQVGIAVRFAWGEGLKVEPGGAVALAALLADKLAAQPDTVVILSGGNVDPALHARLIEMPG